jgi:copper(I)-binding protein
MTSVLVFLLAVAALSAQRAAETLVVRDAWVRESTATRTISSAYFTVENRTGKPITLTKVAVAGVARADLHTTVDEQGQASMRPLSRVAIPAHGTVDFAPGGSHVMLMGVATPLRAGGTVKMTLTFDGAPTQTVQAVVRPLSATSIR